MRRLLSLFSIPCVLGAIAATLPAQITMINWASGGQRFVTTTGTANSIDTTNKKIGAASVLRAAAASNASYLSTGIALDPKTTGCPKGDPGFTIQFWYRPAAASTFQYLFGDVTWTGAAGAFRCFQNGAAGAGNLILRGPLTQVGTTGAPLTSQTNAQGWLHCAVVVNSKTNSITWYINGKLNNTATSTVTTKGKNFTCMGYNGSSSAGLTGNTDAFRVYNWARSGADILKDINAFVAAGNGPSGCPNRPDLGNYRCDRAVNSHIGFNNVLGEPGGSFTRLFTEGTTIEFGATSPAKGPFPAIALMNIFPPGANAAPRVDAYQRPTPLPGGPYVPVTKDFPGLVLGSFFTKPAIPYLFWPAPVVYGNNKSAKTGLKIPTGLGFKDGQRIDIQWIVIDSSFTGFGTTNNMLFQYIAPKTGAHFHAETRGISSLQNTGFFEIWNTGTVPITEVAIDLNGAATAAVWNPGGNLNSGGSLQAGTSYRHLTDQICSLTGTPKFVVSGSNKILTFKFAKPSASETGFQGPINHFVFDCATTPNQAGNLYIGSKVTVKFLNNQTLSGTLKADPKDARAGILDL